MGNCTGTSRADAPNDYGNKYYKNVFNHLENRVLIKTSTWVRDSHELFDYESPHLMKKSFKIQHSSNKLLKRENQSL